MGSFRNRLLLPLIREGKKGEGKLATLTEPDL